MTHLSIKIHQNKLSKIVVKCKMYVEMKQFMDFNLIKCTEMISTLYARDLMLLFPHCSIVLFNKIKTYPLEKIQKKKLLLSNNSQNYETSHHTSSSYVYNILIFTL